MSKLQNHTLYNAITTQRASLQDDTSLDMKALLVTSTQKGSDKQLLKASKQASNDSDTANTTSGKSNFPNLTASAIG